MTKILKRKISLTGYRLFFILQLLIQGPVSKEEILAEINKNGSIGKVSEDTIRLDINTLKSAGFEITTGGKSEGYKYFLDWNTLKIDFDRSELKILRQVKRAAIELCNWEFIANLHEVFCKISKFVQDEKIVDDFLNFGYFSSIDFEILRQLNIACKNRNLVKILYLSPNSGEKIIDVFCKRITYKRDSEKLYLWGKSPQYEDGVFLRVDNILKILRTNFTKYDNKLKLKTCKYRLKHTIGENFKPDEREKITANTPEFLEIESEIYSEFYFVQRILSFGRHCFWVEDEKIRDEILRKLKKMRKLYTYANRRSLSRPGPVSFANPATARRNEATDALCEGQASCGPQVHLRASALSAPAPAAQEQK